MEKEIIVLKGKRKGLTSVIFAGNHGNEQCGIRAFEQVIPSLKIESGTVYFIIANINAVALGVRFSEENLNRMFKPKYMFTENEKKSYEYFRAKYLKQYIKIADRVLDLHSSSAKNSPPFVICEENATTIAKSMPVQKIVHGFAEKNPGGIYSYANSLGKIGIAIECGQHADKNSIEVAKSAILAFLFSGKHINMEPFVPPATPLFYQVSLIYKTKSKSFKLSEKFSDFSKIWKGQIIGVEDDRLLTVAQDGLILFAKNCNRENSEAFVLIEPKRLELKR